MCVCVCAGVREHVYICLPSEAARNCTIYSECVCVGGSICVCVCAGVRAHSYKCWSVCGGGKYVSACVCVGAREHLYKCLSSEAV